MATSNDYNKFEQLSQMPYNIISYLLQNNQNLWKLLNYTTSDALNQFDLTNKQKGTLIYNGQTDSSLYRCFMSPFTDDAFTEQCAQLRIYPVTIIPENQVIGNISFAIEVMSHVKINQLSNYSTRILCMLQEVLQSLNGIKIGGIGFLNFNRMSNSNNVARLNIYNNRSYIGYTAILSIKGV